MAASRISPKKSPWIASIGSWKITKWQRKAFHCSGNLFINFRNK
jgi:hypothetical protein